MDEHPTQQGEGEGEGEGDDDMALLTPEELRSAEEALAEYLATGEHFAWEDVRAWMLSWGTGQELPRPKVRQRA
jgi:hypothetical protein